MAKTFYRYTITFLRIQSSTWYTYEMCVDHQITMLQYQFPYNVTYIIKNEIFPTMDHKTVAKAKSHLPLPSEGRFE